VHHNVAASHNTRNCRAHAASNPRVPVPPLFIHTLHCRCQTLKLVEVRHFLISVEVVVDVVKIVAVLRLIDLVAVAVRARDGDFTVTLAVAACDRYRRRLCPLPHEQHDQAEDANDNGQSHDDTTVVTARRTTETRRNR